MPKDCLCYTGNRNPPKEFCWGEDQENVFLDLKNAMLSAPLLAYPNSVDLFILDTDISGNAIGAELSQLQDGKERTIAFVSKVISSTQKKYCATDKELLPL